MKTIRTLLLTAATALQPGVSLLACATPPSPPTGASWEVRHYTFEPMSSEKQAKLRDAIANCAKVEMAVSWFPAKRYRTCSDKRWRPVQRKESYGSSTWTREEWLRILSPGAELDAVLTRLAAVHQWYTPVFDKRATIDPIGSRTIRLLDAEGKVLYDERHDIGPWSSCKGDQGERVSFADFFPDFPSRKDFGK